MQVRVGTAAQDPVPEPPSSSSSRSRNALNPPVVSITIIEIAKDQRQDHDGGLLVMYERNGCAVADGNQPVTHRRAFRPFLPCASVYVALADCRPRPTS